MLEALKKAIVGSEYVEARATSGNHAKVQFKLTKEVKGLFRTAYETVNEAKNHTPTGHFGQFYELTIDGVKGHFRLMKQPTLKERVSQIVPDRVKQVAANPAVRVVALMVASYAVGQFVTFADVKECVSAPLACAAGGIDWAKGLVSSPKGYWPFS